MSEYKVGDILKNQRKVLMIMDVNKHSCKIKFIKIYDNDFRNRGDVTSYYISTLNKYYTKIGNINDDDGLLAMIL
jgi:hypothetical protein